MNATTDRITNAVILTLVSAGALMLLAALPAVLILGTTGTDLVGQVVFTITAGFASVTGAFGLLIVGLMSRR